LAGSSIVQRGKRFAVVCYAGIDPITKKERRRWFSGFDTRKEAEAFRATLAHNPSFSAGQGPYGLPRLRTGDYLRAWVAERRALGTLTPRTADHTESAIKLHLDPHIGHVPLARLGPPAIQQLYVTLLGAGLAPSTVRRSTGILHVALEDAVKRGLILKNPQTNTTPPKVAQYQPTVLPPEEIARYLEDARHTAKTPALFALYVTAASCGLRIGELLGLSEDAVDLGSRLLRVNRSLVEAGAAPIYKDPKTGSGTRTVLLPDVAADAIRVALVWKKERRLRLGARYRDAGLVFCGPRGRPLNPSNIRNRATCRVSNGSGWRAPGSTTSGISTRPP
jgi:integrase